MRLPQLISPLWNDEAFTWVISGLSVTRWWAAIAGDVHPPLFYGVERVIFSLAPYGVALRLFPLACGLLTVYLAARLARALGASEVPQAAAALVIAAAPMQIYYSAEVRMYSLLAALYLAGAWAVLRRRWRWMAVCMALLLYTHHYGFIYSASLGALALWTGGQDRKRVSAWGALALATYLPLLPFTLSQFHATGAYWAKFSLGELVIALAGWFSGWPLDRPLLMIVLFVISATLTLYATEHAILRRNYRLLWLVFAPVIFAAAASVLVKNVWVTRALIGSAACGGVLLAVELVRPLVWQRWLALGVMAPMLAAGAVRDVDRGVIVDRYATPEVARILRAELRPGDVVECGPAPWMEIQPYRLASPTYIGGTMAGLPIGGLSEKTVAALGSMQVATGCGRTWIFAQRIGNELTPAIPPDARRVGEWTGREQLFGSALYVQEEKNVCQLNR